MNIALAEQAINLETSQPKFDVIDGGRESTPVIGSLALAPLSRADCMLSDVDDLARFRSTDGLTYEPDALASIGQNKITAVKEGAIPYAQSEVKHEWIPSVEGKGGVIRDLGRTAVQTALRGKLFYRHPESVARCDVEVDYANFNQEELKPGIAHVMIAPKMTRKDAPLEVAKSEGLADTDSIQINWLEEDTETEAEQAKTACILVANVPIEAWVSMLEDPENIFGIAVPVDDPESALSVMKTFKYLEIPIDKLNEGPVTILVAVLPYINDPVAHKQATEHIEKFRGNQKEMHETALSPAERWLKFDIATEQSLHTGLADEHLRQFIDSLKNRWSEEDQEVIDRHKLTSSGEAKYSMTRELASVLQNAQRNMILTKAAVVAENEKVLSQMSAQVAMRIYDGEIALKTAHQAGLDLQIIAQGINNLIASQNIKVGGGCSGINQADFRTESSASDEQTKAKEIQEKSWHGGKVKKGRCVNCKEHTDVGVENWCKKCITC